MREHDVFYQDKPSSDYLRRFLKNRDGKKCLLYIITKLGYFEIQETEEARHVRNAAVNLLMDIQEKTGFALDMDFQALNL
jgi:acyl CoA:acetate/3-ketoacid CoA transferase beta subunit